MAMAASGNMGLFYPVSTGNMHNVRCSPCIKLAGMRYARQSAQHAHLRNLLAQIEVGPNKLALWHNTSSWCDLKKEGTWRKRRWNRARGSMFQAIVSVMAVKIQLSSPSGVLRSVCLPGMRSMRSRVKPSARSRDLVQNHRSATCT